MEKKKRLAALTLVFVCLFTLSNAASVLGQENNNQDDPAQKAQIMLSHLSAEEKVGQLFLITIDGGAIEEKSPIRDLIQNYHIGGILLKKANNNFTSADSSLEAPYNLIKRDSAAGMGKHKDRDCQPTRESYK